MLMDFLRQSTVLSVVHLLKCTFRLTWYLVLNCYCSPSQVKQYLLINIVVVQCAITYGSTRKLNCRNFYCSDCGNKVYTVRNYLYVYLPEKYSIQAPIYDKFWSRPFLSNWKKV